MFTDPVELLPKHQYLLEMDFAELGNGSTTERQYWIESMEVALSATDHIIEGGDNKRSSGFSTGKIETATNGRYSKNYGTEYRG